MQQTIKLVVLVALIAPGTSQAASVVVGDKVWRQLTEVTGFSHDQLATVCDVDTGVCSGSLGGVAFSGWTWASVDDVGELFHALTPHPGGIAAYFEFGERGWAQDFLTLFEWTNDSFSYLEVNGWTRTLVDPNDPSAAYFASVWQDNTPGLGLDTADNSASYSTSLDFSGGGAWLYQPANVPVPGGLVLLTCALATLGLMRRWPDF